MKKIKIEAPAKLNLFLEIESKRSDGYHNIESVFCLINLKDEIEFKKNKKGFVDFKCSEKSLESEKNLAYLAIETMREKYKIRDGVDVKLLKKIPWGAGLGGGSSDCAAALKGMIKLFGLKIPEKTLLEIGRSLGADVPFFLSGFKTAEVRGIGEKIKKIKFRKKFNILIVKPEFSIPTKWAYSRIKLPLTDRRKIDKIMSLIKNNAPLNRVSHEFFNRFETVVAKKYPSILMIKNELIKNGACGALMTGSGSAVFGVFETEEQMKKAAKNLPKNLGNIYIAKNL